MRLPAHVFARPLVAVLLLAGLARAQAADLPLWEVGAGLGGAYFPDYRGADQGQGYALPVPYVVYRGDFLRVSREGIRGRLFESENVFLGISADLGPPADSHENAARAGMPDLEPTFGLGPSLNVRLYRNAARTRRLELRLPLRAVVATDLTRAEHIGWVFLPHLDYDMRRLGPGGRWSFGVSFGPIFATQAYHDYYYEVAPAFATGERPAYDAPGGFSGLSAGMNVTWRSGDYWVGGFVRYDNLRGAVFEDSPLVRQNDAFIIGIAVVRVLYRSERTVPVERD